MFGWEVTKPRVRGVKVVREPKEEPGEAISIKKGRATDYELVYRRQAREVDLRPSALAVSTNGVSSTSCS